MKNLLQITISLCILYSCTTDIKENSQTDSLTKDSINASPIVIEGTTSIKVDSTPNKNLDLPIKTGDLNQDVPFEWEQLSEQNGGYVLYSPCMSANPTISISSAPDSGFQLSRGLGQMGELYSILDYKLISQSEFEIYCEGKYGEGKRTALVTYINEKEGIANWTWINSENPDSKVTSTFVDKTKRDNYQVVEESCEEMY